MSHTLSRRVGAVAAQRAFQYTRRFRQTSHRKCRIRNEWARGSLRMAATTVAPPRTRRSAAGIILRVLIALVILIVLLAASAAIWFYWRAHAALPQLDGIAVLDQGVGRTSDVPTIEEPDLQA